MISPFAAILLWSLAATADGSFPGAIEGIVCDGSNANAPLAHAELVLRAGEGDVLLTVASAQADASGRFVFRDLPVDRDLIYLCGVNRDGVHYPGPRVKLDPARPIADLKLISYGTVQQPSPLVAERHEIKVQQLQTGVLEVSESIQVSNPSAFAFVGQAAGEESPITLRLSIPTGVERITFSKEFHGRRFQVTNGKLTTGIPWPPGERTLEFHYRVPIDNQRQVVNKTLDLPTRFVSLQVSGDVCANAAANLPVEHRGERTITFVSRAPLDRDYELTLQLTRLGVPWIVYGRWGAIAVLLALAVATIVVAQRRNRASTRSQAEAQRCVGTSPGSAQKFDRSHNARIPLSKRRCQGKRKP